MRTSNCHPERKHYALGLCSPCWWRQYRGSAPQNHYGKTMVEELEFEIWTWDDLERIFPGVKRKNMARELARHQRVDLRTRVNIATYGTDNPHEIRWARYRRARR